MTSPSGISPRHVGLTFHFHLILTIKHPIQAIANNSLRFFLVFFIINRVLGKLSLLPVCNVFDLINHGFDLINHGFDLINHGFAFELTQKATHIFVCVCDCHHYLMNGDGLLSLSYERWWIAITILRCHHYFMNGDGLPSLSYEW